VNSLLPSSSQCKQLFDGRRASQVFGGEIEDWLAFGEHARRLTLSPRQNIFSPTDRQRQKLQLRA